MIPDPYKITRRGHPQWCVDLRCVGMGRVSKASWTYAQAKALQEQHEQQVLKFGSRAALSDEDQAMALRVRDMAAKAGCTPDEAIRFWAKHKQRVTPTTVADALEAFLTAKEKLLALDKLRATTLRWYSGILEGFAGDYGKRLLDDLTLADVEAWLDTHDWQASTKVRMHNLIALFMQWCVKHRLVMRNVVEHMDTNDQPPGVLPVSQCKALLARALALDKPLLPFAALQMFAGLRRSEAERVMIGGLASFIKGNVLDLWPLHTKTRKRRIIELDPLDMSGKPFSPLRQWLEILPHDVAGLETKWTVATLDDRWRKLRFVDGQCLYSWSHDCLRHGAASLLYEKMGAERAAKYCGHSLAIQENCYRSRFTPGEVQEFWALEPKAVCPHPQEQSHG
jgi:hypothetical protein